MLKKLVSAFVVLLIGTVLLKDISYGTIYESQYNIKKDPEQYLVEQIKPLNNF